MGKIIALISFTFGTNYLRIPSLDPRIKRIKQQEKEAREAKKRGTTPGAPQKKTKQQEEEEKTKAELEAKQKEEAEKVTFHLILSDACANGDELRLLAQKRKNKRRRLRMLPRRRGGSNALQRMATLHDRVVFDCFAHFASNTVRVYSTQSIYIAVEHSIEKE